MISTQVFTTLEFDVLHQFIAKEATSELGKNLALTLLPSTDINFITKQLAQTTELRRLLIEVRNISVGEIPDITSTIEYLRVVGVVLETNQLHDLLRVIQVGESIRTTWKQVRTSFDALKEIFDALPNLQNLYKQLRWILLPTGEINEEASPELVRLKKEIQTQYGLIQRKLESFLQNPNLATVFSDQIITQRNSRFVLPLRNDNRGQIKGIIHAMSSSGATAFIEPLSVIEFNNKIVELKEQESAEIQRILSEVSSSLRNEYPALKLLVETLGSIDLVIAKARLANSLNAIEPQINTEGIFHLEDVRHPILEVNLKAENKPIVPISLSLSNDNQIIIITGPNAGGKTVALKTAGLCALMAQSGLHIPARVANVCIFNQVHSDIGDHQSLQANLSTFSSHITNICRIINEVETPALVLIDEIGTGTDPDEGAALGVSIIDYFKKQGVHLIASTHYNLLKVYADTTPSVSNAAVEFDLETLRPTYRLLHKQAGNSSGIEIAKRLGLPITIIESATLELGSIKTEISHYLERLKIETDYQHDANQALDEERAALAEQYSRLEIDFNKKESKRQKEFQNYLETLKKQFLDETKSFIVHINNIQEQERVKNEAKKKIEQLLSVKSDSSLSILKDNPISNFQVKSAKPEEEDTEVIDGNIEVKDLVRTELGQEGTVEHIANDFVSVRIGTMLFRTTKDKVKRIRRKQNSEHKKEKYIHLKSSNTNEIPIEINVIGCNADEALLRIDKYLDDAVINELNRVRIIHGVGLGILIREIRNMLRNHPHVAKFYIATSEEGGQGATIVELRGL